MKIYTYSEARQKLADILEESKGDEVAIRRHRGDMFSIVPKSPHRRLPFDVNGLKKHHSKGNIKRNS